MALVNGAIVTMKLTTESCDKLPLIEITLGLMNNWSTDSDFGCGVPFSCSLLLRLVCFKGAEALNFVNSLPLIKSPMRCCRDEWLINWFHIKACLWQLDWNFLRYRSHLDRLAYNWLLILSSLYRYWCGFCSLLQARVSQLVGCPKVCALLFQESELRVAFIFLLVVINRVRFIEKRIELLRIIIIIWYQLHQCGHALLVLDCHVEVLRNSTQTRVSFLGLLWRQVWNWEFALLKRLTLVLNRGELPVLTGWFLDLRWCTPVYRLLFYHDTCLRALREFERYDLGLWSWEVHASINCLATLE